MSDEGDCRTALATPGLLKLSEGVRILINYLQSCLYHTPGSIFLYINIPLLFRPWTFAEADIYPCSSVVEVPPDSGFFWPGNFKWNILFQASPCPGPWLVWTWTFPPLTLPWLCIATGKGIHDSFWSFSCWASIILKEHSVISGFVEHWFKDLDCQYSNCEAINRPGGLKGLVVTGPGELTSQLQWVTLSISLVSSHLPGIGPFWHR